MIRIIPRKIFSVLTVVTIVMSFMLVFCVWLTQSLRFIDIIVNKDVTLKQFVSLIYLLVPNLLAVVLPLCATLATVYVFYRMTVDNELVVFKSAGMSHFQIIAPVIVAAVFFAGFTAYLYNYLGPQTNEQFNDFRKSLAKEFSTGVVREGVFNEFRHAIIYVKEHAANDHLKSVYIFDKRNNKQPFSVYAQHGFLSSKKDRTHMVLYNGCTQEINPETKMYKFVYFNELVYDLNTHVASHAPGPTKVQPSLWEMLTPNYELDLRRQYKIIIEAHKRIIYPVLVFALMVFSAALFIGNQHRRRGLWKLIAGALVTSALVQMMVLTFVSMLVKTMIYLYLAYGLVIVMLVLSWQLLSADRTNLIKWIQRREHA